MKQQISCFGRSQVFPRRMLRGVLIVSSTPCTSYTGPLPLSRWVHCIAWCQRFRFRCGEWTGLRVPFARTSDRFIFSGCSVAPFPRFLLVFRNGLVAHMPGFGGFGALGHRVFVTWTVSGSFPGISPWRSTGFPRVSASLNWFWTNRDHSWRCAFDSLPSLSADSRPVLRPDCLAGWPACWGVQS